MRKLLILAAAAYLFINFSLWHRPVYAEGMDGGRGGITGDNDGMRGSRGGITPSRSGMRGSNLGIRGGHGGITGQPTYNSYDYRYQYSDRQYGPSYEMGGQYTYILRADQPVYYGRFYYVKAEVAFQYNSGQSGYDSVIRSRYNHGINAGYRGQGMTGAPTYNSDRRDSVYGMHGQTSGGMTADKRWRMVPQYQRSTYSPHQHR